jgi:hypothetical protein
MALESVASAFLSTISHAGLLFVILLLFILLGSTLLTKKFDLQQLLIALPAGAAFFYGMTVLIYKLNLGDYLLLLLTSISIIVFYIRFKTSGFSSSKLFRQNAFHHRNLKNTLLFAGIASLFATSFFALHFFLSHPGLPLLTSFDTSSGDLFFYLNFADHVRHVGWDGFMNQKFESTPFSDGLEVPSVIGYDHSGTGLVLISAMSGLLSLQVWQVGQVVLLAMWLVVISMASSLIARFSNLSINFSISISILLFCNFAYLSLLGWWALNQIVFSGIFLLIMYLLGSLDETQTVSRARLNWALIAGLVALAVETYPSIATYGLLPIFAVTFIFSLIRGLRGMGSKALLLLPSLLPLTFLALGTGEFIPRLFGDQFGNDLDIGIRAPNYLQFLGFPPVVDGYYGELLVGLLDLVLSPVVIGLASIFLVLRMFKDKRLYGSLLGFTLIVLGASTLLIYSSFNITSYHSHKLALQWVPFLFISLIILFGDSFILRKFRVLRGRFALSIAIVVLGNSIFFQIFASGFLSTTENRQLHSVTKEIVELKAAIQQLRSASVLMDMSDGQRWLPKDRTVSGGLVGYPGVRIDSSWKLSGYPYYTGWAVSDHSESNLIKSQTSVLQSVKVNDLYSLRYVCRLVCSSPSDGVMALVAGLELKGNEFNEYSGTYRDALSSPFITLYLESEAGKSFSYVASWSLTKNSLGIKRCSESGFEEVSKLGKLQIGKLGYSRVRLFSPEGFQGCDYKLTSVRLIRN